MENTCTSVHGKFRGLHSAGGAIGSWFPVSGWAFPNGLTSTGLALGAAATAPLIVWLMETLGWRQSFILTAPLAFLIAGVWWWYARDNPSDHTQVSKKELTLINANRPLPEQAIEDKAAWKHVLKNRDIWLLAASYFCMNYVFYIFFNWFFIYLLVPITADAFGWVPALATGSIFAMIGVGLWFFVRADRPINFHS